MKNMCICYSRISRENTQIQRRFT